ncbi:helix-turn-helix transcriptional regulator [Verrucomicrobiota bacterium sgz303538]
MKDSLLCSKEELAREFKVSRRTIEEWMRSKRIPYLRLSPRMVRFDLERVLAALNRYEVKEAGRRAL